MSVLAVLFSFCFIDPPLIFPVTGEYAAVDAAHVESTPESDYYVVMFTASWCGPCQNVKKSGKLEQIRAAGYQMKLVDIDQDKSFYSGSIPKFWLCKDGKRVHEWAPGAVEPSAILAKINQLKGQKPKVSSGNFFGRKGTSHETRQTLVDHLLSDGIHKGRHPRASLESLSDSELVELHDREHENEGHRVKNGLWKP